MKFTMSDNSNQKMNSGYENYEVSLETYRISKEHLSTLQFLGTSNKNKELIWTSNEHTNNCVNRK